MSICLRSAGRLLHSLGLAAAKTGLQRTTFNLS